MAKTATVPTTTHREEVPDYTAIVGLRRSAIAEIAREHYDIDRKINELEGRKKELKELGATLLIKADVKAVMANGLRVTRVDGHSTRLDKDKLLKLGGPKALKWLAASQVTTAYTSLRVTAPEEKEREE